jgi:hypothetical protein
MTNLLKKLKPEIVQLIENDLKEYPSSTTILMNELKSTYYINELKYFAILDIEGYYKKAFGNRPNLAWSCLVDNYNDL